MRSIEIQYRRYSLSWESSPTLTVTLSNHTLTIYLNISPLHGVHLTSHGQTGDVSIGAPLDFLLAFCNKAEMLTAKPWTTNATNGTS